MKKLILLAALLLTSCKTPIEAYTQHWEPKPNITELGCAETDNIKETIKGVYDERKNFTLYVNLVCVNKYQLDNVGNLDRAENTIIIEYRAGKVEGLYYLPQKEKFIMSDGELVDYLEVVFDLYGGNIR